ncbi:MAG TPA: type II toxin-antitoxin system HicA family toxin [Bacteroidota bacterium]
MKVSEAIKLLEKDGWYLARTKGSHRQYKHHSKPGIVTIAGKLSLDLPRGTFNSFLKQSGFKKQGKEQL